MGPLGSHKGIGPAKALLEADGLELTDENIVIAATCKDKGIAFLEGEGALANGLFPLLIFMGVGAMTDFGPLLAHPKTALLGAAAQFGIFATLIGALAPTAALMSPPPFSKYNL